MTNLLTLAEAKAALNKGSSTADDAELLDVIAGVSAFIEGRVGPCGVQQFTQLVDARSGTFTLPKRPILSLDTMTGTTTGQPYPITNYDLDGDAGIVTNLFGYPAYDRWVRVVYTAGRHFIPDGIRSAAKLYVQDVWSTQRTNVNRDSNNGDDMVPMIGVAVPSKVLALLDAYNMQSGIA